MFNNDNNDEVNLKFLLTASPDVLLDWYNNMDKEDHLYAFELLKRYEEEVENDLMGGIPVNVNYVDYGPLVDYLH